VATVSLLLAVAGFSMIGAPAYADDYPDYCGDAGIPEVPTGATPGIIESWGDVDFFKFTPSEDGLLVFHTDCDDWFMDINQYLYDSTCNELEDSWGGTISWSVTGGSPYYMAVEEDGDTGTYTLEVEFYVDSVGDDCASATPIDTGTTEGMLESSSDRDFYKFTPPEDGLLEFHTDCDDWFMDINQYLYDSTCNKLEDNRGGTISRFVTGGSPYYMAVEEDGDTGTYTLEVEFYFDSDDDDCTKATSITVDSSTHGVLESTTDIDCYTVTTPSDAGLEEVLKVYTTGYTDTTLYLCDSSGNTLASSGGAIEYFADPSTTYCIKVVADNDTGSYTLKVDWNVDTVDDDCANAYDLGCNNISGDIDFSGDKDYFKVVLSEPATLTAYTTSYHLDSYGSLLDSSCNVIEQNDDGGDGDNFRISRSVEAGTYYVSVEGYQNDTGSYTLKVLCTTDDHGNDCDHATQVTCNSSTGGDLEMGGDYDYFKISVGSGIATVYTEYTSDYLDTYGYLMDSSCTVIGQDDDDGYDRNFSITQSLGAGTYYIAVKAYSSHDTGTYTFKADCEITWAITASAGAGGSISPSGTVTVSEGASQSFTITPDPGNSIVDVVVDGTSVGPVETYPFDNVTANHSISATFALPPGTCVDISDIPLDARFQGAPALIMFVLDDSGSMDWEIMTNEDDGTFQSYEYVFDDPGDHVYSSGSWNGDILSRGTSRRLWRSQYSGYNKLYYNPGTAYEPWPTLSDADPDAPRSHPMNSSHTLDLDGVYDTIEEAVVVDNEDSNFSYTPSLTNIIVDDRDTAFTKHDENGGDWDSRYSWDEAYESRYYLTEDPGDYTATWAPDLAPGTYVVSARWDDGAYYGSDRSTSVTYYINHAGGTDTVTVDQSTNGGKWMELGTYTFNGDPATENVKLDFTRAEGGGTVCADAVRFEPTGVAWDWASSSEAYDNHYYWTPVDGEYTATWTPNLPGGSWAVYARWADADSRSTSVSYTINYAGGSDTFTVDQSQQGGQWVQLGSQFFPFNGESSENVTLTHTRSGDTDTVCADAIKFIKDPGPVPIKRAHYYVWSIEENKPYLVDLDGDIPEIKYYAINDANTNDMVEADELALTDASSVPSDVLCTRSYAEERQNFANWYSFYRRRELAATAAVSKVITGMQGVKVGINSINGNLVQPVLNVKVGADDETDTLLDSLYGLTVHADGTPLRRGLEDVGKYYKGESGGIGTSPYADVDHGGECQQAFSVVMTDGYWNGWDPDVDNEDGDGNTEFDGSPYGDDHDETLADVAMYYYETDLSALNDLVPTSPEDQATHQHMVTYTVSFGVTGSLNPDDYDFVTTLPTWPDPEDGDEYKIDDLWHAAVNGRGEFLSASNPTELISSMESIMSNIEGRVGSASSVSVNGDELYEKLGTDVRMFQATYSSDGWTGDLRAYPLNVATGKVNIEAPVWSAVEKLETIGWNSRVIATHDGSAGIAFDFDYLTADQKTALDPNWGTDPTTAQNIINFLKGDDSNEQANGGSFRDRIHIDGKFQKLSDIVHSSPVYHDGVLYAGGNDGMLHAFDADTGNELFAYIPNLVFENLAHLSDPSYNHLFFVDLTPTVEDVTLSGVSTLLVGGLGKGGKGYFALDVSSPFDITADTILAGEVLWEFAESTDLGYTYSRPAIAKSNSSTYPWIVIFGNGYNSEGGYAKLFILDASNGNVIKTIDTHVGDCNGLSTPTPIDVTNDQTVDYVYAGDLKGNLWKFDLTSGDYANWASAYKSSGGEQHPQPLFQAKGPGGSTQPITAKVDVMNHCEKHGYIVVFGTGQYLGEMDMEDTSIQSLYGIWDYGDDTDDDEYLGSFERGATPELSNQANNVTLLQQILFDWRLEDGVELRTLTSDIPYWGTVADADDGELEDPGSTEPSEIVHAGWFYDLPDPGERVVSEVLIRDEKLVAISFVPEASACGSGGYSWLHEGDACTGARLEEPQFDINGDSTINASDLISVQVGIDGEGNPVYEDLAPTEIKNWGKGRLQPPTILRAGGSEIKYLSSSSGRIETVRESSISLGISYWMECN
jgi:hypothetical protein